MARRFPLALAVLALGLALALTDGAFRSAVAAPCEPEVFEDRAFTVCTFDLRQYSVRLFWRDEQGRPYAAFGNLPEAMNGQRLVFAMNGGMYHADLSPVGLYIEDGREMRSVSTTDGPGNFHLKPNGVFYVHRDRAAVVTTSSYVAERPAADHATQSGPMLVIDGELHPRFLPHSTSRRIRNGVGVRDDHTAVFAISEDFVTFHEFGRFFRDRLGTANALYLDGTMSSLFAPALGRADARRPMGPIIGVLAAED